MVSGRLIHCDVDKCRSSDTIKNVTLHAQLLALTDTAVKELRLVLKFKMCRFPKFPYVLRDLVLMGPNILYLDMFLDLHDGDPVPEM
ncbi:unnamed protein product [Allacma fusca]|uniref:Uncharacterized protein n=1 Tax=Allacma fusca TaxID=39272 RepID=A0A8J2NT14_9HEXA|nr:unnamed protein product [Allacma fusca]